MNTQTTPRTFAAKLRAELRARGIGPTDLARDLAPRMRSRDVESTRRLIHKHLNGAKPNQATRRRYELALGLEIGELDPDPGADADEEADPLAADLMRTLRALIAQQSNAPTAHQARSAAGASTRRSLDDSGTDE